MLRRHRFVSTSIVMMLSGTALAQVDPLSGIDFVTIGDVGNANWTGGGSNNNRGRVDYEYRIGRFEVTTAQWVEFMNAAMDRPANDRIPFTGAPLQWGAAATTPINGGSRWRVPAGREMLPTGGITWRTAAIYCNWLHNGKGLDRAAFLSGAYDVSTFTNYNGGPTFTDQRTRSPGARYFIPSLDEWMKAAHWDPSRSNGDGTTGGWWLYSNSSDEPFRYGPAGVVVNGRLRTANAGWDDFSFPGYSPFDIPLGAYTGVTSPWGLMDVAGATREWLEECFQLEDELHIRGRRSEGSQWDLSTNGLVDTVQYFGGGEPPNFPGFDLGLRIAAVVPAPGLGPFGAAIFVWTRKRKRR